MITDEHRAGHAVRVRAPKLVEAVVAEQYRRRPDLLARYGEAGRAFCARDVGYHLRFLAASVETANAGRFVHYVRWARRVLVAHGVPPADLLMTLDAMRRAAGELLPAPAAQAACRHIDAAVAAFPA